MSLSVEIVTDNLPQASFFITQVVSVAEQTGLSLAWLQTQYLCQHALWINSFSRCLLSADFYSINFF